MAQKYRGVVIVTSNIVHVKIRIQIDCNTSHIFYLSYGFVYVYVFIYCMYARRRKLFSNWHQLKYEVFLLSTDVVNENKKNNRGRVLYYKTRPYYRATVIFYAVIKTNYWVLLVSSKLIPTNPFDSVIWSASVCLKVNVEPLIIIIFWFFFSFTSIFLMHNTHGEWMR